MTLRNTHSKEKCWSIEECLPIKCTKKKNRHGEWDIIIPKMSMKYETFMDIDSSITHMESYGISYDYVEGVATMSVTSIGLKELQEMTDVIRIS
jgi:hypothetical protein